MTQRALRGKACDRFYGLHILGEGIWRRLQYFDLLQARSIEKHADQLEFIGYKSRRKRPVP